MKPASRTSVQKQNGLFVARTLLEVGAVSFCSSRPYTLTSGWASPVYIDCRRVISYPYARRAIIHLAIQSIVSALSCEGVDAIAGGETAGIPYAAWLSEQLTLPMLYVRKKPKGFGRNFQIEGHIRRGQHVLLVDDQATDGSSKINFCKALREAGAIVKHAIVVFYYGIFPMVPFLSKGENNGIIQLHYLTDWWDILEVIEQGKFFDEVTIKEIRTFLCEPVLWSAKHGGRENL